MDFIIKLFLNSAAAILAAYILPGVHLESFFYALILAALLAVLNVSVKPILIFLTIPATIVTLGLFLLVINAFIIEIAAWVLTPSFYVDSFWWALLFSILLSLINSIFERLSVKAEYRDDSMKVFDKDGKRIL